MLRHRARAHDRDRHRAARSRAACPDRVPRGGSRRADPRRGHGRPADEAGGQARDRSLRRDGRDGAAPVVQCRPAGRRGGDALIHEQADIETVLHFPTRGRNLLRLQGDLLGAYALGIRNLFVCVGDPVTIGEYPHGSNNVDVTATGLLSMITHAFNAGVDRSGTSIGAPTSFFAGAAVAPSAPDLEREARLLARKAEAGARFVLTQPFYSIDPLLALRETYEKVAGEPLTVPVIAGVLPLMMSRHAEFLHNEVPGIEIPEAARNRMRSAGDDDDRAWEEGAAMAIELIAALREEGVAGVYVMPQFGRYDRAAEVVEAARGPATM
ncbi:MAG: hypothetical protein E6G63_10805 [Actinobacteria bacterium]|nr:MAG: hypothetical protein E6G63_10805 [Actinomycetota bacterium]